MANTRKTCLITGCSSGGVGAALAEAFKDKGYHVFATARSPSKVTESLHAASNITVLALDVTSSDSIAAAAEAVRIKTGGKLDVLINNAGHGLNMPALDTSTKEARAIFDANFFGVLEVVQAFQHMLIKSRGVIVNNASMGGVQPIPFITTYNATKAALIVAGEGWRLELAPLGVRVITLITGGVATNFLANLQPLTLPEDSYYMGIEDIIAEHPEDIPLAMKTDKYALEVVNCVEKGMSGKHWIGGGSVVARLAMWMMPQFALDWMMLSMKPFTKRLAEEHGKRMAEEDKKAV